MNYCGDTKRVLDLSSPPPVKPVGTRWDPLGPVGTRWDPFGFLELCTEKTSGVDYTERRKTEREENTSQREEVLCEKEKIFSYYATMNE